MLYVAARSLDGGRRARGLLLLGIQTAEVVYIALAAAGLSAVLAPSPAALSLLEYAGAAILIASGIRQWLRGGEPPAEQGASVRRLFAHGFVVQVLNPTVAVLFVAFFPSSWHQTSRSSFRFSCITVEDMIAEGDKVVGRNTVTGTHQGEYMGVPPTGRSITYNEIFICRFAGGRIAETWRIVDVFSQMKQLGLIAA